MTAREHVRERAQLLMHLCRIERGGLVTPRGVILPVAGSGWSLAGVLWTLAEIDLLGELMPKVEARGC